MDNKINDKHLELVTGGITVNEEAISGAISYLQDAVALFAQAPILSTLYGSRISNLIQSLRSCNGEIDFYIRDELNDIERRILSESYQRPTDERQLYRDICVRLYIAKTQLGF